MAARDLGEVTFHTGWKLFIFRARYVISLVKYLVQRRKYALFSLKFLKDHRKGQIQELPKVPRFGRYYYPNILNIPRWPSAAYDRMVAAGGLNLGECGTTRKLQIDTAILAVTRRCEYRCRNCYEANNLAEKETVPVERWQEVVRYLQDRGTSVIVLSGGEPMLRFDGLLEILAAGDPGRSDFHIHTSGYGITRKRAETLKRYGVTAAAVALDDVDAESHDRVKGYEGAHLMAVQAIRYFREAGIFPYVNLCLRRELLRPGVLWRYLDHAKRLNPGVIFMLEPRPCGRFAPTNENSDDLLSAEDRQVIGTFFKEANRSKKYKDHPYVDYIQYYERPEHFGCLMGGLSFFYVNSSGGVQPCSFLPVSFGNILEEDFSTIFERMRKAVPAPLHRPCPAISLAGTIKSKREQHPGRPVQYKEIDQEWQQMFCRVVDRLGFSSLFLPGSRMCPRG